MSVKVVLKNVRIAYAHLFQPFGNDEESKKFSTCVILPKNHAQLKEVNKAIIEAAKEKWESKIKDNKMPSFLHNPLNDGNVRYEEKDQEEFKDVFYFNCSSKRRPQIFDKTMEALVEEDGKPYSGCYCNLSLNFYPFEVSGNKGVAVGLNGVQFVKDGEPLAASVNVAGDFGVIEDDDDYSDI